MDDKPNVRDVTTAVIQPEGDLVAILLPALRARLREMIASGILNLTFDLAQVGMVDSAGIGLLIATHNSLKKAGGKLAAIHASQDVLGLLQTMRIHQHFSISGK